MIIMAVFGYVIQRGLFNFAMDAGPDAGHPGYVRDGHHHPEPAA